MFVNAATWALLLTGGLLAPDGPGARRDWSVVLRRLIARLGAPVIRRATVQAMLLMSRQFVIGRTMADLI